MFMIPKKLRYWLPVVLWCGVIFFFSSMPSIRTPFLIWWDVLIKKTGHLSEYAVLYTLLVRALYNSATNLSHKQIYVLAIFFGLSYAFSDEIHQYFTPGRQPAIMDVGIDLMGMLIALKLIIYIKNHHQHYPRIRSFLGYMKA